MAVNGLERLNGYRTRLDKIFEEIRADLKSSHGINSVYFDFIDVQVKSVLDEMRKDNLPKVFIDAIEEHYKDIIGWRFK